MKFRTDINPQKFPFEISHHDKIFMIGSCFTDNIAHKLLRYKFNVLYNPFGIIYNPYSISKIIDRVLKMDFPKSEEYFQHNNQWHHFDFHSEMSGPNKNEVIERVNILLKTTNNFILKSDIIFITLGTSIIHKLSSNNNIVANNHKLPSNDFIKSKLDIDQIFNSLSQTITKLKLINPDLKIIFTVSPVRHLRNGIIENQRSKARLILAIEKLVNKFDSFYFPSYEILQDDLRDYRYYNNDLIHPSDFAINYIWEKFSDTLFSEQTKNKLIQIEKITKSLEHKPFAKESIEYQTFSNKLKQKIVIFEKENPEIKF